MKQTQIGGYKGLVEEGELLNGTWFPSGIMKMFQNKLEVVADQYCECTKYY